MTGVTLGVDEARQDMLAGGVDDAGGVDLEAGLEDRGDLSVADGDIRRTGPFTEDDVPVFDQQIHALHGQLLSG